MDTSHDIPMRYCLYARKSTERDEKQALSIDSQVSEMLKIAERDNLEVMDIRRESHSAKDSGKRPVFNELIEDLGRGRFNGLLVWHPDRLSRNAVDLGALVDLMDKKVLVEIRTYGQIFTNSPSEKFLLMILGSQAKLDNDNKSVNVKRGLRMRCEMGLWPAPAPTGYLNTKRADRRGHVTVDSERAPVIKQMFEKVAYEKWTGRKLYHWLKFDLNFKTPYGNKNLTLSNVHKILNTPFYYGEFEWPAKSGNWYAGKHKPIITKELFEKARKQLKRDRITRSGSKEFAFTKLIKCGLCGSGITAQEKFKSLKDGSTARYVYYGCSRSKDRNCKSGYLREEELLRQMKELVGKFQIDEGNISRTFTEEYKRFMKFKKIFFRESSTLTNPLDIHTYASYVLQDGSLSERRALLSNIENHFVMLDKHIRVYTK